MSDELFVYAVRCPDGHMVPSLYNLATGHKSAHTIAAIFDRKTSRHRRDRSCSGPHTVVRTTVNEWEPCPEENLVFVPVLDAEEPSQ